MCTKAVLMAKVAGRDPKAMTELIERYGDGLKRLVTRKRWCRNDQDLEDLLLDVWHIVWEKAGQFDPKKGGLRAWLYTIAHNLWCNHQRRRGLPTCQLDDREGCPVTTPPEADPQEQVIRKENIERVRRALEKLSPEDRELLKLRHVDGFTYKQIATALGCSVSTAHARVLRAHEHLRKLLGDDSAAQAA
jgi:RNA polymerase sigma-70 factor (ECF subfamily)